MGMSDEALIWQLIYRRFPKLPTERTCMTEYRMRQAARQAYEARIRRELQPEANISAKLAQAIAEVRKEVSAAHPEGTGG